MLFYLTKELSTYPCPTYISWNIGLPLLSIFHFSLKMSREKGSAVKSQIFILSMCTPLPNVKQLSTRKEKTTISDTQYSERFWSGLPVLSSKKSLEFHQKKNGKKPFLRITQFTRKSGKLFGNLPVITR